MKTFINNHPFITLGIVCLVCETVVMVTSILKEEPQVIFFMQVKKDVVETASEEKQEA